MTCVLQISDPHIVADGALVSGRLETAAPLERLVMRLQDILPRIGPVDALLISGDVSDDGTPASYARFARIIAPLDLPTYVIPGNHDARDAMRDAFTDDGYLPATGRLNWHLPLGNVHLIGLDTLIEGAGGGTLDAATLAFLGNTLAALNGAPVLLALHHPPFATGIHFMDAIGLDNADALQDILRGYRGEVRVVCGHIHSMMTVALPPHIALSSPAPCSHFAYDRRAAAPVGYHEHAGGCLLHRWDGRFSTVHIPADPGPGPFPF
ncbi:phosphodiesterase [Rhodobacteraceae bacterium KMM 6894]|nr:phosphodiesterase [Rhodobacteraceae bacterium KMM 6894]